MGSTVNLNLKCGIKINGRDALQYHPLDVASLIASDKSGMLRAMFKAKMMDDEAFPLPDNYAEHVGRPSLTEVPYMRSENDGYPFLPGHDPLCDGKEYYGGRCKCKYDKYNKSIGHMPMWPGGPDIDDFDM